MRLPYWFTPVGCFNFFIAQWFFVRLEVSRDTTTGDVVGHGWLTGVAPLTGWYSDYIKVPVWVGLPGLWALLWLAGCAHVPVEPADPVEPPQAREACEAFCDLYTRLECDDTGDSPGADEIDGTADDVGCVQVCRDSVTALQSPAMRECLDTANTCDRAEQCIFGRLVDRRTPSKATPEHPQLAGEPAERPPHEPVTRPGGRPGIPRTPPSSLDGMAKSGGPKYRPKARRPRGVRG